MDLTEEQRHMVGAIQTSSSNLLGVINDILDFSQIEQGAMTLRSTSFNIVTLVQSTLESVTPAMLDKKLDVVHIHETPRLTALHADQGRIRQCIINLVSNAIKFSSNDIVTVRTKVENVAGCEENMARLSIAVQDR